MVILDDTHVLMIEPKFPPSSVPNLDGLTLKATALLRSAEKSSYAYKGRHSCTSPGCEAVSDVFDHVVSGEPFTSIHMCSAQSMVAFERVTTHKHFTTNSLAVHYLAYHRSEVPTAELNKLVSIFHGIEEVQPTDYELTGRS